jgi:hypothetical protein
MPDQLTLQVSNSPARAAPARSAEPGRPAVMQRAGREARALRLADWGVSRRFALAVMAGERA